MDIDSYDHVEDERNGAASNSDRYLTPVEYQVISVSNCPLNRARKYTSICLDTSPAFKFGTLHHFPLATPLHLP
jgi:hypothetical protein